jgi:hypothetical protein
MSLSESLIMNEHKRVVEEAYKQGLSDRHFSEENLRKTINSLVKAELHTNTEKLVVLQDKEQKLLMIQRILDADKSLEDLIAVLIEIAIKPWSLVLY